MQRHLTRSVAVADSLSFARLLTHKSNNVRERGTGYKEETPSQDLSNMQQHQQPFIAWSITSYRDRQLLPTLQSGLYQAHFASRLLPVVCWQGDLKAPCCSCFSTSYYDSLSSQSIHQRKKPSNASVATVGCSNTRLPLVRSDGTTSQVADGSTSDNAATSTYPDARGAFCASGCRTVCASAAPVSAAVLSSAPASSPARASESPDEPSSCNSRELRRAQNQEGGNSWVRPSYSNTRLHGCRTEGDSPTDVSCFSICANSRDAARDAADNECTCWCHSLTPARSRGNVALAVQQQTYSFGDSRVLRKADSVGRANGSCEEIPSATFSPNLLPSAVLLHCSDKWRPAGGDTAESEPSRRAIQRHREARVATEKAAPQKASAASPAIAASTTAAVLSSTADRLPSNLCDYEAAATAVKEDLCSPGETAPGAAIAGVDSSQKVFGTSRSRRTSNSEADNSMSNREGDADPASRLPSGAVSAAGVEHVLPVQSTDAAESTTNSSYQEEGITANTDAFGSTRVGRSAGQRRCPDGEGGMFLRAAPLQKGEVERVRRRRGIQDLSTPGVGEDTPKSRCGSGEGRAFVNSEAFPLLELYRTCWAKRTVLEAPSSRACRQWCREGLPRIRTSFSNSCYDYGGLPESCAKKAKREACRKCCRRRRVKPLNESSSAEDSSSCSTTSYSSKGTCSSRRRVMNSSIRTHTTRTGSGGYATETDKSAGSSRNRTSSICTSRLRLRGIFSVVARPSSRPTKPSQGFPRHRLSAPLSEFPASSSLSAAYCSSAHTSSLHSVSSSSAGEPHESRWSTAGRPLQRRWSLGAPSSVSLKFTSSSTAAPPRNSSVKAYQMTHMDKTPCTQGSSRSGRCGAESSATVGAATEFLQEQPLHAVQHLLPVWVHQQLLSTNAAQPAWQKDNPGHCHTTRLSAEPPVIARFHLLSVLVPPSSSVDSIPAGADDLQKQGQLQARRDMTEMLSAATRATRALQEPQSSHEQLPGISFCGRSDTRGSSSCVTGSRSRRKCCRRSDSGRKSYFPNWNSEDNRINNQQIQQTCEDEKRCGGRRCRSPFWTETRSASSDSMCSPSSRPSVAQSYSDNLCKSSRDFSSRGHHAFSRNLNSLRSASNCRASSTRGASKNSDSRGSSGWRDASRFSCDTPPLHTGYAACDGERLQLAVMDLEGPCTVGHAAVDRAAAAETLRVRFVFLDWRNSRGPCFARYVCEQVLPAASSPSASRGELLLLQTDSHMRFAPHYDCFLVRQLYLAAGVAETQERSTDTPAATTCPGVAAVGKQGKRCGAGDRKTVEAGADLEVEQSADGRSGEAQAGVAAVQSEYDQSCYAEDCNLTRDNGNTVFLEDGRQLKRKPTTYSEEETAGEEREVSASAEKGGATGTAVRKIKNVFARTQANAYSRNMVCSRHTGSHQKRVWFLSCCVACGSCCNCPCSSCSCCCSVLQRCLTRSAKEQLLCRRQPPLSQTKNSTYVCTSGRLTKLQKKKERLLEHRRKPLPAYSFSKPSAHASSETLPHSLQTTVLYANSKRHTQPGADRWHQVPVMKHQKQPLHSELPPRHARGRMLLQGLRLPRVLLTAYPPGYEESMKFYEWPDSVVGVHAPSRGNCGIKENSARAATVQLEAYGQREQLQSAADDARGTCAGTYLNDLGQCAASAAIPLMGGAGGVSNPEPCVGAAGASEASGMHSVPVAAVSATGHHDREETTSAGGSGPFRMHTLLPPVLLCAAGFDQKGILRTTGRVLRRESNPTCREYHVLLQQQKQQQLRQQRPWRQELEDDRSVEGQEWGGKQRQEAHLGQQHGTQHQVFQQRPLAEQQDEQPGGKGHQRPQHDSRRQKTQKRRVSYVCGSATLVSSVVGGPTEAPSLRNFNAGNKVMTKENKKKGNRPNDSCISVAAGEVEVEPACCCCCYKRALQKRQGKSAATQGALGHAALSSAKSTRTQ